MTPARKIIPHRADERVQLDPENDIEILGVRKAEALPPARRLKTSKYEDLIHQAATMRPGEVLEVQVTSDEDLEKVRQKISATIRRYAQPLTSHRLMTRTTERGTVGIYCYPQS